MTALGIGYRFALPLAITCQAKNEVQPRSGVARQNLRDVQHARRRIARAPQAPFDIQHAAEVAQHDGLRAARLNIGALLVADRRRDIAELPRKRTPEAAAMLAVLHLRHGDASLREQRARLLLDAQLAQPGAGV